MPSPESPAPFLLFTQRLHDAGLRYMISGSVAAIYYGEPRMTNDVDIILHLPRSEVERLVRAFPPEDFYCPPAEVILLEVAREQRGHFNLLHHESGFKADVYLIRHDPLHIWGLEHARSVIYEGHTISLAPPEYVILRKLQFYREGRSPKHLRDINRMLSGLGAEWSRVELLRFVAAYRLETGWQEALQVE